ncbi:OTU domain-containing protein 6B [Biscogniauxia mediterranea]|nr:OTU domain-containing protein 6B [Biscogniauxia mediterranea]
METLEDIQSRHRKEQRDLQSRITNKKKNATKKNRKGINDECAQLERQLKERQEQELAALNGEEDDTTGTKEAEKEQDHDVNGVDDTGGEDGNASAINKVTNKLKETSISSSSSSSPAVAPPTSSSTQEQQQTAQGGGGQGKKRNRQKERMARRAAEQEAAAAAAEAEAANMTDHRTRERTYLEREFRARGLAEREIRPDGHCLFAAVADQLAQLGVPLLTTAAATATATKPEDTETDMPPYRAVRRAATDYMAAHADDFAPFLGEEEEAQGGLEGYLRKIRDTAEWGGQLELRALASAYGVEIKVIQDGRTETIEPSEDGGGESSASAAAAGGEDKGDEGARKTVWLAYYRHGYGLGEHYNSLRKAG